MSKGSIALLIVALLVAVCPFLGCASAAERTAAAEVQRWAAAHAPSAPGSVAAVLGGAAPAAQPDVGPPAPSLEQIQEAHAKAMAKLKADYELAAEKQALEGKAEAAKLGSEQARAALARAAGKLGIACTVAFGVAILALLLSCVVGVIPKTASAWCFGFAGVCLVAQYGLLKYGVFVAELAFWVALGLAIAAGAAAVVPFAIALVNWSRSRVGKQLIAAGDVRAGVAVLSTAHSGVDQVRAPVAEALEHMANGLGVDHSMQVVLKKLGIPTPAVMEPEAKAA